LVIEYATALADAIDEALPGWVERCVRLRALHVDDPLAEAAREAGLRARAEVGTAIRELVLADVDEQWTNPLSLLRGAVRYPTEVLASVGVPAVDRDDFARDRFPDDPYDLTPATWSDIHESLASVGIAWGAAKAFTHKQRHRS
jgi:hypothetical protein